MELNLKKELRAAQLESKTKLEKAAVARLEKRKPEILKTLRDRASENPDNTVVRFSASDLSGDRSANIHADIEFLLQTAKWLVLCGLDVNFMDGAPPTIIVSWSDAPLLTQGRPIPTST